MSNNDPDFERLKDYDFGDARTAAAFPHLVKHQLERLHRLTVAIDDDLVKWLANDVPPEKYAQVMNSALREFRKKQAA
jgi:succinate dehydrogenase flavin-adding protein (antitoxin of CptAB toxin-antitoxin module)